jgi:nitrogenase molybdenum-iron protein alpha chain
MSYYNQNIPPVRDQRLKIGDTFPEGKGCDLLQCSKTGCLIGKKRSFWQANACQMALTLMMAGTIENSVIVMHGPIGCGTQLHVLDSAVRKGNKVRGKTPKPFIWLSTNLKEQDVIGGGEAKLKETIEYADKKFRPEIIFVVATCAPNIIGDDIEEVVKTAREITAAKVVALHCPGFKSRVVATAYDTFYHGLLRYLPFEPIPYKDFIPFEPTDPNYELVIKKYQYKRNHTVNLFNATSIGPEDEKELVRLLNALDLNVQIFAEYSSADELRLISQAALNVSMCNVHDDYILKYLEQAYGIPYVIQGMPIGVKATREWLLAIAKHFGLEERAKQIADQEEEKAMIAIQPYLPALKEKRVLIGGGVIRVAAEAILLETLGMKVISVRAYHFDNEAEPVYEVLNEELPDIPISVSNQSFELVNQIQTLKPDLVVTHNGTNGIVAKLGIPTIQLFSVDKTFFGYSGLFDLTKRIGFAMINPSYHRRLGSHVKQPYQKSWYEKDAFSYVK